MNQILKAQEIESRINPATAGAIAVRAGGSGLTFQNAMEMMEFSKLMAISDKAIPAFMRGNVGTCLGVTIQASDWGMSPYAVARQAYVVNDQLAYMSQIIQAVILLRAPITADGFDYTYDGEGQTRRCTATVTTLTGKKISVTSPMFKDIKVKNSALWTGDPDQQFSYFTGRALCRRHFPHVLLGVYDVDEMEGAATQAKDVTPDKSLAEKLAEGRPVEARSAGFDASTVAAELDQTVVKTRYFYHPESESLMVTTDGAWPSTGDGLIEEVDEARYNELKAEIEAATIAAKVAAQDDEPEAERAGATAAMDGQERKVPEDFTASQAMAWLKGFDAVAGEPK